MSNATNISSIVALAIAAIAVLGAIFIYRNVAVFGIGGDLDVDQGTLFVDSSENRVGVKRKLPNHPLDVVGDINTSTKLLEAGFALIPAGTVVMWTGALAPNGWVLCDGGSYSRLDGSGSITSPDLRGRFVLGQGQGAGLTNRVLDATGGEETHQLTLSELASHTHSGTTDSDGAHVHSITDPGHSHLMTINNVDDQNFSAQAGQLPPADGSTAINTYQSGSSTTGISVNSSGTHTHTFTTGSSGGDHAHNNMPPFYVLAYIMKI